MKKKIHTVGTVPKSSRSIVERPLSVLAWCRHFNKIVTGLNYIYGTISDERKCKVFVEFSENDILKVL